MPGNDLDAELDADLNGGLDAELDADLAAPAQHAGKVIEMPVQEIQGEVPKAVPWYESLARGAYQGATLGFGDELAGRAVDMLSGTEDNVDGIREDNAAAAKDNPISSLAGNVVGSAPMAAATAGLGLPGALGANAAAIGATKLGNGTGDLPTRAVGAGDDIAEHPVRTAAELAAPAAGKYAAKGLESLAGGLKTGANKVMTQTFMTPQQRTAYELAKGPGSLAALGKDARDAGLFAPTSIPGHFKPATAARVAQNAQTLQDSSGKAIGAFEDDLAAKGFNPDVPVSNISKGLQDKATEMGKRLDQGAPADAKTFQQAADHISQPESLGDGTSIPGRGSIPLADAIGDKRDIAGRINWQRNPNAPATSLAEETARKYTWAELKDAISRQLDKGAQDGAIDPKALEGYTKANKDYSVAATAYEPALKMAERQGQAGLNLTDLMAGAAMGDGGLSAMASKAGRGIAAGAAGATMHGAGTAAGAAGKAVQPSAMSWAQQQDPTASKPKQESLANSKVKDELEILRRNQNK